VRWNDPQKGGRRHIISLRPFAKKEAPILSRTPKEKRLFAAEEETFFVEEEVPFTERDRGETGSNRAGETRFS